MIKLDNVYIKSKFLQTSHVNTHFLFNKKKITYDSIFDTFINH